MAGQLSTLACGKTSFPTLPHLIPFYATMTRRSIISPHLDRWLTKRFLCSFYVPMWILFIAYMVLALIGARTQYHVSRTKVD